MKLKHLFGPVPSRRLGISLGVDLIPYKTCTLNCVYCECGETTDLTITRKEYIPVDSVIAELEDYLKNNPRLDYIAFAGSGDKAYTNQILRILSRRPCTVEDLQAIMDLHPAELLKYVNHLLATGRIEMVTKNRGVFLKMKNHPGGYA
ncbi:MAG: hypothetical protein SCJ97_04795 [Bacillota bacterium]|nr:hypothetical protein [Bacillota bacterium]